MVCMTVKTKTANIFAILLYYVIIFRCSTMKYAMCFPKLVKDKNNPLTHSSFLYHFIKPRGKLNKTFKL